MRMSRLKARQSNRLLRMGKSIYNGGRMEPLGTVESFGRRFFSCDSVDIAFDFKLLYFLNRFLFLVRLN